jgi:hypothetical protein
MKKSFQSISSKNCVNEIQKQQHNESMELASTCSVCAELDPKFWAVSVCGHKICWICSLRLRALYNSKLCPICKSPSEFVFICKSLDSSREFMVNEGKLLKAQSSCNSAHGIYYENDSVSGFCESLLQLQCPFNSPNALEKTTLTPTNKCQPCLKHFKTKFELRRHVQTSHELLMCEICLEHKKCFTVELALYNRSSLQKHQKDANHPRCKVCDRIFYSEDELAEHNRHEHELCHICQRTGHPNRYFLNYTRLEEHFGRDHFLCPEPLCKELKFVVFENELEYKAHQAEVHLSHQKMQRSQQRHLQRLNISFGGGQEQTQAAVAPTPEALRLTSDQRNQIGLNLVYGQVTDDLANRMQSLSLYQTRNDAFLESLRGPYHLDQSQIQRILDAARAYQRNETSATEFVLKLEKIIAASPAETIPIARMLSDLQLNEPLRQRIDVAIHEYQLKCNSFPELPNSKKQQQQQQQQHQQQQQQQRQTHANHHSRPLGFNSAVAGASKTSFQEEDPFGFARPNKINYAPSSGSSETLPKNSFKVLHIVKSNSPNHTTSPAKHSNDPSRNPAMLLSHLAGAPRIRPSKKSTGTVKMTTFSSAAVGSLNTVSSDSRNLQNKKLNFDEKEFPSLGAAESNDSSPFNKTSESPTNALLQTRPTETPNAFFAPSDRDQLESFTIGSDDKIGALQEPEKKKPEKKNKKLVFKYGQKWDM